MLNTIVIQHPKLFVYNSLPKEWQSTIKLMNPNLVKDGPTLSLQHTYAINDVGYNALSRKYNMVDMGFSQELSEMANNKYRARRELKSMQNLSFTICNNNIVDWSGEPTEKLIAKPVSGAASTNVYECYHGDKLPDIGESYIVEKFIDKSYDIVGIDGYICGGEIEVLCICDEIRKEDDPTKLYYLGYPSKYQNHEKLNEKYIAILKELNEKTGCNNQIINIELFIKGDEVIPIEINPRIAFNTIPIYEEVAGCNPWKAMESLKNGKVPVITSKPRAGIVRYNYRYSPTPLYVQHNKDAFSTVFGNYSHTFVTSATKINVEELASDADYIASTLDL